MALDIDALSQGGRTLILNGLAQSDIDMAHFKLLNLDDSNLTIGGAPPTFDAPAHQWIRSWNATTRLWGASQPVFGDISGNLTIVQQRAIIAVGTLGEGTWRGNEIEPAFLPRLDQLKLPAADLNVNLHKVINVADPTQPGDAVNKRFMDMLLQGLNPKEAVRVATTASVSFFGQPVIDGVVTNVNDRILVKNETGIRAFENGIWVITASGHWTRATDVDNAAELNRAFCKVREGNVNGGTGWVQVFPVVDPIGTEDLIQFVLFSDISGEGEPGPPGPPGAGVPEGGEANQLLAKIDSTNFNTRWVDPGVAGTPPLYSIFQSPVQLNPVGTNNASGRMMGLGATITPNVSGKVIVTITGFVYNTSPSGSVGGVMRVGPGVAPVNGAVPPTGSFAIGGAIGRSAIGANMAVPFSVTAALYGLQVGNLIWFDVMLQAVNAIGTSFIGGVSVSAYEIP